MEQKTIALLAVVGMLLFAGCLNMTMTTEVSADGDIDSIEVDMEVDQMLYNQFEEDAAEEGYDSVAAMWEADIVEEIDEDAYGSVSSSSGDGEEEDRRITVTVEDVDPDGMESVDIELEDGTIAYEDTDIDPDDGFGDDADDDMDDDGMEDDEVDDEMDDEMEDQFEQFEDQITMEYVVVMPGEIQETNAHNVSEDGTTATWDLLEIDNDMDTAYVESDVDEDDGVADSVSGFGVGITLSALLIATAMAQRFRQSA